MRLSRRLRWALAGLLLAAGPALAQQATLDTSPAVQCLTPASGARAPDYPFEAFKTEGRGRVVVSLRFTTADTRPEVTVTVSEGDSSFVDAVKERVRDYRVPCLAAGAAPVVLNFEFVFRPDDRQVLWGEPTDAADPDRRQMLQCVRHTSGDKAPDYLPEAARAGLQGRVLVRLRFTAPDQPPEVQVFPSPPPSGSLEMARLVTRVDRHIERWAADYRMPCHTGAPVSVSYVFVHRLNGEVYGFKPGLTLRDLLPLVKGIKSQKLALDTTTMGCPFDVRWHYRQPSLPNAVGQVGNRDPARRPLLDWLRQITLDASANSMAAFYGDTALVQIPCVRLNLNPQE